MKQTLTLTPSTDPLDLDPWLSGSPLVITGTEPAWPDIEVWRMQLWKRPHDAGEEFAEPLASAVGAVASGTLTIAFSAGQIAALNLSDAAGANNYTLTLTGTTAAGGFYVVRSGTIEINRAPWADAATPSVTTITISDDFALFEVDGVNYRVPVEEIEIPDGASEGEMVVIDDMAVFTPTGGSVSYTWPVEEVEE